MLTLVEIDASLAAVDKQYTELLTNYTELIRLDPYKLLSSKRSVLVDASLARAAPGLDAIAAIGDRLNAFEDMVEAAKAKRKQIGAGFIANLNQQAMQELEAFLSGKSIMLPPPKVSAKNRKATTAITPIPTTVHEVVKTISDEYDIGSEVVHAFGDIWDQVVPILSAASGVLDGLETDAESLGVAIPELNDVRAKVTLAVDAFKKDPFTQGAAVMGDINPAITSIRQRLQSLKQEIGQLTNQLSRSSQTLATLKALQQTCSAKLKECRGAIKDPVIQPRRGDLLATLETTVGEAQKAQKAGDLAGAVKAIGTFVADAEAFRTAEQAAVDAYAGMLAERIELRDRLTTYTARANRHGIAENDQLQQIAKSAESILYHRPDMVVLTPLPEARRLVEQYRTVEEQLSSSGAK